jgi:MSHA biogenesis protein MshQ
VRVRLSAASLRTLALCLALLGACASAHGQSQTASPGNCANQGGFGAAAWASAGNATASDGAYAAAVVDGDSTNYLRCLGYGFSIPLGATILGIEVHVERKSDRTSNGGSQDAAMRLVKAGAVQATDRATATVYTTVDAVETHGGPADLWGTTWTAAEINAADFGAAFAATKPSANGPVHNITVDHISITVYYNPPTTPGSFNAFETATAAGAVNGVIGTRVAGTAFSLDVVAILGGAQLALFNNAVRVELLGNTVLGTPLDAQNCPSAFTVVQTVSPDPGIVAGRSTVGFAAVPNAWRDVRVRVSYPAGAPTVTACSTDNFAIRPASFSVAASDADWQSAGTARVLANTGAAGGVVHKAGRSFTLTVTPSPLTATNYNGDPTVSAAACSLPAGCATGAVGLGAFASVGGSRVSDTATYSEAGAFDLTLIDQGFASVDAADGTPADCTASGRYVCQSPAPAAIGRFVPDRFALTALTQPVFRTFDTSDASCSAPPSGPTRSFTYVGQPFGYATAPVATVVAQNASGGTTTNYRGALWKLAAADAAQSIANAPVLPIDASQVLAPTLAETPDTGMGTLSANALDKYAFTRDTSAPSAPFTASLALTWSVSDASEAAAGQGTIGTASALVFDGGGTGIAFDAGAEFRYGRLRMASAYGSQLVPLPVPVEAQYWIGAAGFATNAADNCTALAAGNVALAAFSGNLAACETAVTGGGTLTLGRRTLFLAAPGSANDGSVTLTANLDAAASGTTCTVVGGATVAAAGANRPWLQGNWTGAAYDDNPGARATFGAFRGAGEIIFMRENF